MPAFALVMAAAPLSLPGLFLAGNFLIGFGAALFGHGTLTATMERAARDQAGLALGSWGAVQATAAGLAIAASGVIRDGVDALLRRSGAAADPAGGYLAVYAVEIVLLLVTMLIAVPLLRAGRASEAGSVTAPPARTVVAEGAAGTAS